ncbi:MAG: GNAT family N-acetyltransferase [Nitrospinota bacterium]|nr:GNAT family N-acetyltransferase [Nitrospinota bacterium]MDH5757455.1 GNAT family N-acetyltransferase [Nitrospinota bacterium]
MGLFINSQRIRFRPGLWADIPAMFSLDARLFPPHSSYDLEVFHSLMLEEAVSFIVAHAADELAGYMILRIGPEREASALTIDVDPAYQNHGIGARLMALSERLARLKKMKAMVLQVSSQNHRAMRFYEKLGYTRVRFLRGYYGGEEDGWEMKKDLVSYTQPRILEKESTAALP